MCNVYHRKHEGLIVLQYMGVAVGLMSHSTQDGHRVYHILVIHEGHHGVS